MTSQSSTQSNLNNPNLIPVHIVTGFLGSGKTTFIKNILKNGQDEKTLILVNELGEVGIDDILVQNVAENTYLMPNGCVCCAVLSDLKMTLFSVLAKRNAKEIPFFDKILIETTGLANPASLLSTIMDDVHLKGSFVLNGLTTIIDGENAELQYRLHPEWLTQVVASQQLFISKSDRIDDDARLNVAALLTRLNEDAEISLVSERQTLSELFAKARSGKKAQVNVHFFAENEKEIHAKAKSFVVTHKGKIDWLVFGIWFNLLLKEHGENILRVKGILNLAEFDMPVLIQGVQHCLYPPEHLEKWPWEEGVSKLVFIVRNIDGDLLKRSFKTFMTALSD